MHECRVKEKSNNQKKWKKKLADYVLDTSKFLHATLLNPNMCCFIIFFFFLFFTLLQPSITKSLQPVWSTFKYDFLEEPGGTKSPYSLSLTQLFSLINFFFFFFFFFARKQKIWDPRKSLLGFLFFFFFQCGQKVS
jgi:hypothetical protein